MAKDTSIVNGGSNSVDSSEISIGTADLVLGSLAEAIHVASPSSHQLYIPQREVFNILHALQLSEFKDELRHLDFDRIGPNSFSPMLERILFQAAAWGLHRLPNPALGTILIDEKSADAYLKGLEDDYKDAWPYVYPRIKALSEAFVRRLQDTKEGPYQTACPRM